MTDATVGFAICGSYCTFETALETLSEVCNEYQSVIPIMSENAYKTDSRFGKASDYIKAVEDLCSNTIISSITEAEPIGPQGLLDLLIIAPCTGNTLAKIAHGITDSSVTMAAKAHLRNNRPLLIAVSTNDGLSGNAENIGRLLTRKNIYFVPFYQDDPHKKPTSLISDLKQLCQSANAALRGEQIQPLLCTMS